MAIHVMADIVGWYSPSSDALWSAELCVFRTLRAPPHGMESGLPVELYRGAPGSQMLSQEAMMHSKPVSGVKVSWHSFVDGDVDFVF
jgi:hypothetical protein